MHWVTFTFYQSVKCKPPLPTKQNINITKYAIFEFVLIGVLYIYIFLNYRYYSIINFINRFTGFNSALWLSQKTNAAQFNSECRINTVFELQPIYCTFIVCDAADEISLYGYNPLKPYRNYWV